MRQMRPLAAVLLLLGSVGCAVPKDMSQRTGEAPAASEPAAATVREPPPAPPAPEPVEAPQGAAGTDPPNDVTVNDATPTPVPPPPVAPARLLGRMRAEVEKQTGPLQPGADGWARHGELELRLRDGRCVSLRGHVPADMDCAEVPNWLGYGPNAYPLRRADHCEWPGLSPRHRLAEGVAGSYVPATREFEIRLRDRSRGE